MTTVISPLPPPRVEVIDPNTGMMSREWYSFFRTFFTNAGDPNALQKDENYAPIGYTDDKPEEYPSVSNQQNTEEIYSPEIQINTMALQDSQNVDIKGGVVAADHRASDGSVGITTTITTASLVGKTITIKNGIITSFA